VFVVNLFCNVWVCVCVGFVICGCFDICVGVFVIHVGLLVFAVFLYCWYCVFYCFVYVYLFLFLLSGYLLYGLLSPSEN
jgi:hypothetical protein